MIENANPAKAERILPPPVSDKKEYDRYFQTEYDSKGLNRRLLSGGELSYPENLESLDLIQSAPGNLFATALMTLPPDRKNHGTSNPPDRSAYRGLSSKSAQRGADSFFLRH